MRAKLCSLLNGITLIGLGVVLLDFFFTGRLDQYLHPQFRPWTLVGGIIFCVAGIGLCRGENARRNVASRESVSIRMLIAWLGAVVAFSVLFVPLAAGRRALEGQLRSTCGAESWIC